MRSALIGATMGLLRLSVSLFGTIAVVSAIIAGAAIWLLLSDPITVVDAINEGNVSPLVRELAGLIYDALWKLLRYL